jgi:hypothetical protein
MILVEFPLISLCVISLALEQEKYSLSSSDSNGITHAQDCSEESRDSDRKIKKEEFHVDLSAGGMSFIVLLASCIYYFSATTLVLRQEPYLAQTKVCVILSRQYFIS